MAGGVQYNPEEFGKPQEYCHPHHRIPTDLEPAFVIGKDESCCPPTGDPCECITSGDVEKWNFVYDNFSALSGIDVSAINDFVDDVSALNSSADKWNDTYETVSFNSANWNTVNELKVSAENHKERIEALETFSAETEESLSAIDDKLDNLHFDNDITNPDHSISGDGTVGAPFGVNDYVNLKNVKNNYDELNSHIVKFSADGSSNTLYEFDGAAYNVARIDSRLSGIDQTNSTQNSNIQRNYELITDIANQQRGKQDRLTFGYNNSGYVVSINNSALVGEMGGLTGDIQGALDQVYENSANWSEVSAKLDSSAFDETISAINDAIATKLDTSAFEDVSGTFYTTDNPSGFIDKSVNDLINYYTTAQTYSQTEIDEKLADFGGFEVVTLTTGDNPVPDVAVPSTKIIYLTKDSTSQATDPYTEWIFTSADASTTAWEVIGETTVDLSNYYTKSETSAASDLSAEFEKYVQTAATGTWDVINYTGTNGIDITGHEVGLSSDYKDAIENVSGKLDSSAYAVDSATFYTTANISGFITGVDLTPYQTISGMTAYQLSGNYMSANALDNVSGDWNEVSAKLDSSAFSDVSSTFATTAQFAGSSPGLVPSATTADANKALRGDGTWGDVSTVSVSYDAVNEELHLDFSNGGN